jgi:hypothetical protein
MNRLVRALDARRVLARHAPPLLLSLTATELFYKLGSFTLELLALLATWYVLGSIRDLVIRRGRAGSTEVGLG